MTARNLAGRVAIAAAAFAAGAWGALEHLRGHNHDHARNPRAVPYPCPHCERSLSDGPHHHDTEIVWPTAREHVYLLTDRAGARGVIYDARMDRAA